MLSGQQELAVGWHQATQPGKAQEGEAQGPLWRNFRGLGDEAGPPWTCPGCVSSKCKGGGGGLQLGSGKTETGVCKRGWGVLSGRTEILSRC